MWRLGFFFHEMAFGLLSIFLPLYIVSIGGSLVHIGIMSATALVLAIPASFFWGYLCDKTRHYKRYILISFLSSTIMLFFFTISTAIGFLIMLYAVMSIFHVAHEAPKNVLIAEFYTRKEWEKAFAFYEGFTETGWLIGLLLGFFMSIYGIGPTFTLLLCSGLNLVAFTVSLILVTDPLLIFERSLVNIEKAVGFTHKGMIVATKILDGLPLDVKLKKENHYAFFAGLVLFSLATSMLFTPLPVFFSHFLAFSTSVVFVIYALNSAAGVVGYFLAGSKSNISAEKSAVSKIVIFRSMLALSLISLAWMPAYTLTLSTLILVLMGFAYALFLVFTLSLSMELMPQGKTGLFNVLVGLGGAGGSFVGPFLAETCGFTLVFVVSSLIFLLASVAFKIFA
jgi:MFS family permease